jgi:hypothetical protein
MKLESYEIDTYYQHFDFMKEQACDISLVGHSHRRRCQFTREELNDIVFNEKVSITNFPCGFVVPSVANGTEPNGVAILDTEQKTMVYLPL